MSNSIRKIFNCGFVLFLFVPLFIYAISPVKEISLSEKRKLTRFPEIDLQSFSLTNFTRKLEAYWNDHFGLRDDLITFNTKLQQRLFSKSSVEKVIQGKEGWLFLNLDSIVSDFLGMNPPTEETLQTWTTTLEKREEWLAKHGIHYLVLPVPNKMNIYPEYLPARYTFFRQGDNKTNLDHLLDYSRKHSSFTGIIELSPVFFEKKKKRQLYYRGDSHWNERGAYLAYLEIIQKMKRWYPELSALSYSAVKRKKMKEKGDLANMMGKVASAEQPQTKQDESACSGKMFKLPNHDPATTQRHPQVTTCEKAELTAVITYDSFLRFLVPHLSASFKRVTYVSRRDIAWLKNFLLKEKPDVFIHERVARKLEEVVHDDWGLDKKQVSN